MSKPEYFQHAMRGDVCFGCGSDNPAGLKIHSYWDGDEGICRWQPQKIHEGWDGITCGGIIATLIDCHCMATAMATAIRNEGRPLMSEPYYRFATGMLNIKYLAPTPNDKELALRAHVTEIKNEKKYTLECNLYSDGVKTAEASVVAFLVHRSDQTDGDSAFG
ncbi:MAG: PaaI family thioesterase [Thiotrichaceae bacterium]|nr:PaaI family thioesterase [Thiotrichaceae bacterium]PCI14364.1 MAG: thioesterase superfamily [Thiotrichales bacterium]